MTQRILPKLILISILLTLVVMGLGAFTRLVDGGLGCPDWPGCYGHLIVPHTSKAIQLIDIQHPATPLVTYKAWAEMTHRYFAGTLATLVMIILGLSIYKMVKEKSRALLAPTIILTLLVIYQPILGMWTVTLKLLPLIVTQHMLGGISILACLWWLYLKQKYIQTKITPAPRKLKILAKIGIILLFMQIALGAWTSTNYASLACAGFPFCSAHQWFPHWQFHSAFDLFSPIGVNYDGGVLSMAAKQTIQMVHRFGALIVSCYLLVLAGVMTAQTMDKPRIQKITFLMIGFLALQVCLGIANVLLKLTIPIAVGHNLCAGFLLLSLVTLNVELNYFSATQQAKEPR